jgi:DNA-binding transcriptional LysR family regulator
MISASPRRLSVFKHVVDLGGFNAAASRLGIAQPSVGAHVKALESAVGQPLFVRHRGSRPQLTKAGEMVYAFAVDILRKSAETTHTLADLKAARTSEIVIAAHRDIAAYYLPRRLTAFAEKRPGVKLVTRIGTIEEVTELVRDQSADLGLILSLGPTPGVASEFLGNERLEFVAAPDHPLARSRCVTPADLSRTPFVTGLRGSRFFQMTDATLKRIGVERYKVAMELQESAAVKEVVRHGKGIACLPRCTVKDEIAAGLLVALPVAPTPRDLQVRCVYRAPLLDTARAFLKLLRD